MRWQALDYGQALLHRVALVDIWQLASDQRTGFRVRPAADEVWLLLAGDCTFAWQDHRASSPTRGSTHWHHASEPTLVLAPFGVAFGILSHSDSRLVRLATEDGQADGGGQPAAWIEP